MGGRDPNYAVLRDLTKQAEAVDEVVLELARAVAKHDPMRGTHEGWAVIFEELDELWDEVRLRQPDPVNLRKEAMQVAAMAIRFMLDVAPKPDDV